jgi:outer membrane lipoprotein-sorting protein
VSYNAKNRRVTRKEMRKIAWILSLTVLITLPAFAQKDKRAQDILDAMSKKYKSLKSYQAAFTYASVGGGPMSRTKVI